MVFLNEFRLKVISYIVKKYKFITEPECVLKFVTFRLVLYLVYNKSIGLLDT